MFPVVSQQPVLPSPILSCLVLYTKSSSPTPGLVHRFGTTLWNAKLPLCVIQSILPTHTHKSLNTWNRRVHRDPLRSAHFRDLPLFAGLTLMWGTCLITISSVISDPSGSLFSEQHAFLQRKCKWTWPFLPDWILFSTKLDQTFRSQMILSYCHNESE